MLCSGATISSVGSMLMCPEEESGKVDRGKGARLKRDSLKSQSGFHSFVHSFNVHGDFKDITFLVLM